MSVHGSVHGVVLAVHGGAGSVPRGSVGQERERAYHDGLTEALRAGYRVLTEDGSSLDAVETAVRVLEDDPSFNAGRGAVLNADAAHELDASIMNGRDLRSGAVLGVRHTRNPVSLARLVMDRSDHVMLAGAGADAFATRNGMPHTAQDYFFTQRRWDDLMDAKRPGAASREGGGTVGAVAVDRAGDLAAATSTGGMTNMLGGRVGDSAIAGAGTYADNRTVAVSCTGAGEGFVRAVAAYDICALMAYTGAPVRRAAAVVINEKIPALGAAGGVIALDPRGELATPHSTAGLVNGYVTRDGRVVVRVYDDETPTA
ncbi:MAG: beta-aspartyl-peptidase [Actinophytocola sp.]|uniref:isoaspartyl peptidase/L-asparaginase family protein n=1 Tax=Actinophytocola sp. TaxID=1872138 RepID=UPI0013244B78|nr:isoaspartyl peptidase/L-asparaginase [Actinophytocola sp.]MPZ82726.1 beta-aspartyl-peptidase [Actinophytocola sp.]